MTNAYKLQIFDPKHSEYEQNCAKFRIDRFYEERPDCGNSKEVWEAILKGNWFCGWIIDGLTIWDAKDKHNPFLIWSWQEGEDNSLSFVINAFHGTADGFLLTANIIEQEIRKILSVNEHIKSIYIQTETLPKREKLIEKLGYTKASVNVVKEITFEYRKQ